MTDFFNNLPLDDAELIESLSRVAYELRENRTRLLGQYEAEDAEALLGKIMAGQAGEHPAYEHYLSVRILEVTREAVRAELKAFMQEVKPE